MNYKIHPLSDVQSDSIGENSTIWQFCVILKNAVLGKNCNINCNVFIENDVLIGDNVTIKSGVQLWDGLRIGNNVFIGPNVSFTNNKVPRSKIYPTNNEQTIIDDGASIGANSTIISGITIGKYAFVGAGSVVTKNIPEFTSWYGHPAKHKGFVTKEGVLIDLQLNDKLGNKYVLINNEPMLK